MNIIINTMGKDCPIPLMELKKAITQSQKGALIEISFSCPEAVHNLPTYCQQNKHEIISFEKMGIEGWKMVIQH